MSDERVLSELTAVLAALEQARAERAEILGRVENAEATARLALQEVRSLDSVCAKLLLRVDELELKQSQAS